MSAALVLVEDDPVQRDVVRTALERAGWPGPIVTANDGHDGLAVTQAQAGPTVVLTDLRMPRAGGLALLTAMRADPALAHVPVFVLTSARKEADLQACMRAGAAGVFRKTGAQGLEATAAVLVAYAKQAWLPDGPGTTPPRGTDGQDAAPSSLKAGRR